MLPLSSSIVRALAESFSSALASQRKVQVSTISFIRSGQAGQDWPSEPPLKAAIKSSGSGSQKLSGSA